MSKIRLYLHKTITSFNFETSISVKRIITCVSKSKERYSRNTMSTRLNSFAKRNTNLYNIERNYLKNPRKFHSVLSHYYEHYVINAPSKNALTIIYLHNEKVRFLKT